MIEDLLGDQDPIQHVLYYYCSHADVRSLDSRQIIGGLLKQLILSGIMSLAAQEELLISLGTDEDNDCNEKFVKALKATILAHPVAFLIVDGLDECKVNAQRYILTFLNELTESHTSDIRILVTCRDESQTLGAISHWPKIHLSENAISGDLQRFVSSSVRSSIEKGDLEISDTALEQEVVEALTAKAHGMWVVHLLR